MSVVSKPILNAVGWYFEQLFNNPIKTKAVTRSVDKSKVILLEECGNKIFLCTFPVVLSHPLPAMCPKGCPQRLSLGPSFPTAYSGMHLLHATFEPIIMSLTLIRIPV